jgi:hypothetical protein
VIEIATQTGPSGSAGWEELVFADSHDSAVVSRAVRRGTLRRLGRGVLTGAVDVDPAVVVRRHLWRILAHDLPGAVIADASVRDGGLPRGGRLFVVHPRRRPVELAGVVIHPRIGPGRVDGDMSLPDGIWMSSTERALLDNLAPSRSAMRRTLTRDELERWLETLLQQRGEDGVNRLRDRARSIAPALGRTAQLRTLESLVGAALGTRTATTPVSDALQARAGGEPFDERRLDLFSTLVATLRDTPPDIVPALPADAGRRALLPFCEAYFSNFIEGTEFSIGEAADIVFDRRVPPDRPEDAHDVLGTFEIVSDDEQMRTVPHGYDELRSLLLARHAVLLARRPETTPGHFKTRANRAGSTDFVAPDLVEGTLRRGFELAEGVVSPFARAVYMMFLVSEVHPFTDGNGRIARIFANAELVAGGEVRIVIPTVFRTNYLAALKAATHAGHFAGLVAALSYARRYTARVDFTDRRTAEEDLRRTNAFRDPTEADLAGVRLTLPPGHTPRIDSDRGR